MSATFELTKNAKGQFHFNLKAANGQVVLSSEAYESKASATNGIDSVRKNCKDDARFERKTANDGREYFVLKATNGQVIGQSQMYANAATRDQGIASVKENGGSAKLDDKTSS